MKKKWTIKTWVLLGMLTALSIVLTRLLGFYLTPQLRFSLGNIPIILAGVWLGPVAGGVVGAVSDIVGSYMLSPMGWYPPLTISPFIMGLTAGISGHLLLKKFNIGRMALVVFITNLLSSILCATYVLAGMSNMDYFALLAVRGPFYVGMCVLDTAVAYILCKRLGTDFNGAVRPRKKIPAKAENVKS